MRFFKRKTQPESIPEPATPELLEALNAKLAQLSLQDTAYSERADELTALKQSDQLLDSGYILQIDSINAARQSIAKQAPEIRQRIDVVTSELARQALSTDGGHAEQHP